MSIVANKFPKVRAALVWDTFTARMAREHNDANVLVIGGRTTEKGLAKEMVKVWLDARFEGGRHQLRLDKIREIEKMWGDGMISRLKGFDPDVYKAIVDETRREEDKIVLIASENYASEAVMGPRVA